ncbi:unnamed protein product [Orchesella dallaii]|uniref:Reverse transcriptase domain-containing protein n=1 Tax=Orchesella dallaii TaxID=48710 RepID=A0ABP1PZ96_9HEXA
MAGSQYNSMTADKILHDCPVSSSQPESKWIASSIDTLNSTDNSSFTPDKEAQMGAPNIPAEVNSRGILFCHQNVNSIRNKFDEVRWFVETVKPAVFSITESKLDPHRDVDNMYIIENYYLLRFDRTVNSGGGTVIYVKCDFQYEILDPVFRIPDLCEINVIRIKKCGVKPIIIVTVYKHPNISLSEFISCFEDLNQMVGEFKLEVVIMGDFNINLLDICTNENENETDRFKFKFYHLCKEYNLWQLLRTPTHNRGGLIDHIYVTDRDKYSKFGSFSYGGSDHKLCFVIRKKRKLVYEPRVILVRSWKKIDWEAFKNELVIIRGQFDSSTSNEISQNTSQYVIRNVDKKFDYINRRVMELLDKYAPLKKRLVKGKHNPWFNSNLRTLCNQRNKAQEFAIEQKTVEAKKNYRQLNNKRNLMLSNNKALYFQGKFEEACDSSSLWDTINELTQFRRKSKSAINQLHTGSRKITDKSEICDILADTFVLAGTNDTTDINSEIKEYCNNFDYVNSANSDKYPITVTHEEVYKALSAVKVKRSYNPPNIAPARVMKNCGVVFLGILVSLFTNIINNTSVPLAFKKANVMPLYKGKGSRLSSINYRPISLLNDYCKIFEKFLSSRILDRVENQLNDNQHAYRANRSCHTALTKFTNDVFSSIDKPKTKVGAIYIDFSKAFDSIDHTLFVKKLMYNFKLEPWIVKISNENLKFRVFTIDNQDKCYDLGRGICQGSAYGPLTFSLYINDISDTINIPFLMYADDIVIYTEGKSFSEIIAKLEQEMLQIQEWCKVNHMSINYDKTKLMFFYKSRDSSVKKESMPSFITIGDKQIERVEEFKYLGVIIDSTLTFSSHFKLVVKKISDRLSYLRGFKRYLNTRILRVMVNSHLYSIIDYGIDIWAVQSDTMLNELQAKIDRFLFEFEYSTNYRNRKTVSDTDLLKVRKKFNFLSVKHRRDLILLKSAFLKFHSKKLEISERESSRLIPLMKMPKFQSQMYKSSVNYRTISLWNGLPKNFDVKKWGMNKFVNEIITHWGI